MRSHHKQLFVNNSFLGFKTFVCVFIAVFLLFFDGRTSYLNTVKIKLAVLVFPIQYVAALPYQIGDFLSTKLVSRQQLLLENTKLRTQQLLLQTQAQQLDLLLQENAELHSLLNASKSIAYHNEKISLARILAISKNPFDQQMQLDIGKQSGVFIGQTVVDASGLVGQVIAIGPLTSKILAITSTQSAVPVQDNRNGIRAVAVGNGYTGDLNLLYVPNTLDIQVGDTFITSGLDKRFSVGYKVGIVKSVQHSPNEKFALVKLNPCAELNKVRMVLLVWPQKAR